MELLYVYAYAYELHPTLFLANTDLCTWLTGGLTETSKNKAVIKVHIYSL